MAQVLSGGVELRCATRLGTDVSLDELEQEFDAVLLAIGATASEQADAWNLPVGKRGLQVLEDGISTARDGVFAAGLAVRGKAMIVRSAADGKEAAQFLDRYVRGAAFDSKASLRDAFTTKVGRLTREETLKLFPPKSEAPRQETPVEGFSEEDAKRQAARCLECGCKAKEKCRLREYATVYGAQPSRYRGSHRQVGQVKHAAGVVYEPGKCIDCGLCTQITSESGEELGLTFVGRGFNVQVGVPFDESLEKAIGSLAKQCVQACPTAALHFE